METGMGTRTDRVKTHSDLVLCSGGKGRCTRRVIAIPWQWHVARRDQMRMWHAQVHVYLDLAAWRLDLIAKLTGCTVSATFFDAMLDLFLALSSIVPAAPTWSDGSRFTVPPVVRRNGNEEGGEKEGGEQVAGREG